MTTTATRSVGTLAEQLAQMLRTYEGQDLFAPGAFFDINVPEWRFQVLGVESFVAWLRGYAPQGYRITVKRVLATDTGFVAEVEGEYEHHGTQLYFRNLYVADVDGNRITDLSFWCTGDWDPETRARHAVDAPMVRK